jgi:hypothetical protein
VNPKGRRLARAEVSMVRAEVGRYQEFAALTEQIAEVERLAVMAARQLGAGGAGWRQRSWGSARDWPRPAPRCRKAC